MKKESFPSTKGKRLSILELGSYSQTGIVFLFVELFCTLSLFNVFSADIDILMIGES
jgi:hypothetical protein